MFLIDNLQYLKWFLDGIVISLIVLITIYIVPVILFQVKSWVSPTVYRYVTVFVLFILSLVDLFLIVILTDINTTVLLTVVAIISAGISIALHQTIGELFNGLKILSMKPYRVDDYVTIGETNGIVKEVNPFGTILYTPDDEKITINNVEVFNSIIVNHSAEGYMQLEVKIPYELLIVSENELHSVLKDYLIGPYEKFLEVDYRYKQEVKLSLAITGWIEPKHYKQFRAIKSEIFSRLT